MAIEQDAIASTHESEQGSAEVQLAAIDELVLAIQANPKIRLETPQELAAKFNLPISVVKNLIQSFQVQRSTATKQRAWPQFKRGLASVNQSINALTRRTSLFIFISTVGIAIIALAGFLIHLLLPRLTDAEVAIVILTTIFVLTFQALAIYRSGTCRTAVFAALCWFVFEVFGFESVIFQTSPSELKNGSLTTIQLAFILVFAALIISAIHAVSGCLLAVLGAYSIARKEDIKEEKLSRIEILQRYFEIRERLKQPAIVAPKNAFQKISDEFDLHGNLVSLLIGIIYGIASALLVHFTKPRATITAGGSHVSFLANSLALLGVCLVFAIPYISKTTAKALINATLLLIGSNILFLVPLPINIHKFALQIVTGGNLPFGILSIYFVAFIAIMANSLTTRSDFKRKLIKGDRDSLVVEFARLRGRLHIVPRQVTILVIDAVKSSKMKELEDPIEAEFAFRIYQEWIEKSISQFGGRIHATAGDGAIIVFDLAEKAYESAKYMQSDLARFNQEENRLRSNFRVRIGLHTGSVSGDVDQIVFTATIDISAHVEGLSPVGGIAVTEPTRQLIAAVLPSERFALLPETMDGFAVYTAVDLDS